MNHLSRVAGIASIFAFTLATAFAGTSAYAQGSFFTSLTGTVADSSGAVIPGADVRVKNNGTGEEHNAVTGADGGFTIPSLPGGSYSVTVALMGFKTAVLASVTLNAAIPASVKVTLEVGGVSEKIEVRGEAGSVVQTQSPAIATNLSGTQIINLPLTSRNALDSLTSLPGFNTSGTGRDSTVNGLPKAAINITLDGMSVQDNYLKTTDGYFARLTPTLDSVEEVTVTTAGNTADATGQGGVQIKFVTKSGTNAWRGTAYEYYRTDKLNANTWFNNRDLPPDPATGKAPKAQINQYQQGIAQGGPIVRNKAFFFFNYEDLRQPGTSTLQRVVLSPTAAAGTFSYNTSAGVRQVNLFQLAAANGQLATIDPTVSKVLGDIGAATQQTGGLKNLTNPLVQQYTWNTPTNAFNPSPTFRIDYDVTERHRLTGSMNYRHINSTPDTTNSAQLPFPGFATTGSQQSTRWTTSESLRSTLTTHLVNEARIGASGGATLFSPELNPGMWNGTSSGIANQNGLRLNLNGACCGTGFALTNPGLGNTQSSREASTFVIEDQATWLRGKHSVALGGSMIQATVWLRSQTLVPTVNFGLFSSSIDPAAGMFTASNFPGASAPDLTNAGNLYAMLTGRIISVTGDSRITPAGDKYVPLGQSYANGRMREFDFYGQDQWRVTSSLTISAGLRYVLPLPFYPLNNSYTTVTQDGLYGVSGVGNLFMPGTLTGTAPNFVQYPQGAYAYNSQKNGFAPSLGFAWTPPDQKSPIGRLLLGSQNGDSVIRAGAAMAYQRPGLSDFTGVFGANQGIAVSLVRDSSNSTIPILLRNSSQLALPTAPPVSYPILPTSITNTVNAFDPNIKLPYTQSWQAGWQRKLGQDTAVEVRYVGSRHRDDWWTRNLNEINITTNGFLPEFRAAQANLQANLAAGKGATFAYTGAPGTSPLPVFLGYLNGEPRAQAGDPSRYSGGNWTNSAYLGFLAARNPNPFGFASTASNGFIGSTTLRNQGAAAGLPRNFFVANPDVIGTTGNLSGANLTTNGPGENAHSLQLELRKRLAKGVQFQTSYTYSRATSGQWYGFTRPAEDLTQTGTVGNVLHSLKANWLYELPFGRNQRFAKGLGTVMDGIVGGWALNGVARVQTGEMLDFGNVRLVGMTIDQFRSAVGKRVASNGQLYILPQDIIDNTVKAFAVSATTASGYAGDNAPTGRYLAPANGPDCIETAPGFGDCGIRSLVVNGPALYRFDLAAVKSVRLRGISVEFRAEMLNAFNTPYFTVGAANASQPGGVAVLPVGFSQPGTAASGPGLSTLTNNPSAGTSADSFRLVSLLGDNTSRIIQFVWRIRW
jgi:hypothetical protein